MKSLAVCSLLALLAVPAAGAAGLQPYLVKDINPVPAPSGSNPAFPVTLGGAVLFSADDGVSGRQLWRSDGTAAGTWQLSDASPGELPRPMPFLVTERLYFFLASHPLNSPASLWVSDGTPAGTLRLTGSGVGVVPWRPLWMAGQGVLYFVARDAEHGSELWRSDGTPAGTYLVADVRHGSEGSNIQGMAESRGRVWFGADDGLRGGALWSTDGTEAGTALAVDPAPAAAVHGIPEFISVVGSRLTFFAPLPGGGPRRRLWAGDGTQAGTVPIQVFSGSALALSAVPDAVVQGNRLYFVAEDRKKGQELWVSDGTARGTRALTAFAKPGAFTASPYFLDLPRQAGIDGRFVFRADDGPHGIEPWITDGTPQGTRLLRDVCVGSCSSAPELGPVFAGRLYFSAFDRVHGLELWATDGTRAGTRRVFDVCPGECSSFALPIGAVGSRLLFAASDVENGRELWSTDGTAAGTVRISDFEPGYLWPDGFFGAILDGRLVFAVDDGEHGDELWSADGTPGGTRLVEDIDRTDVGGSFPRSLRPLGSQVVFTVPAAGGLELWKSDGTEAGTVRFRTFGPGDPDGASPEGAYAEAGGLLFYESGSMLWRTDGTEAGTFPLTGPGCCLPREMQSVGSTVFFERRDEHGFELWASDGTVAGTRMVLDIVPGPGSSDPGGLAVFQGRLWFSATAPGTPGSGRELWTSDGTAAGTVPVADILPGAAGSAPSLLAVHAGRLWFFADDGIHGRELWSSDGTAAGTRLEVDVVPGSGSQLPQILVSLGDRLVFSFHGGGLWVSDGTPAGTRKIHDRELDFFNAPLVWTVFEGRLYYAANGILWSTDGTEAGTGPLLDRDGRTIFAPHRFAVLGDRLVFTAQDVLGPTLWESDGTPAGTFPVEPRVRINSPEELAGAGNRVFFPGYDRATGWELWAVRP